MVQEVLYIHPLWANSLQHTSSSINKTRKPSDRTICFQRRVQSGGLRA
jgi:hypothetical protein